MGVPYAENLLFSYQIGYFGGCEMIFAVAEPAFGINPLLIRSKFLKITPGKSDESSRHSFLAAGALE